MVSSVQEAIARTALLPCADSFCAMSVSERRENKTLMRYLLGESMGGAVALHLHRKEPTFWDGAVLVAPMCKVTFPRPMNS